ncbi:hypothetical protein [Campylobacter troglodytis]|uniref:hypothetical protein n=1 Tax=Campylobacter troglodytis TaxID=654363 RepID=UPI001159A37C|nr:hypothetical protein [Campylobacter troglodytis]
MIRDKARGFSIIICPKCKSKYKTKPINKTYMTIIMVALGIIALFYHICFDIGYLLGFFGIFVCGKLVILSWICLIALLSKL